MSNPIFKALLATSELILWEKRGVRLYPDSLFADDCGKELRKAGQRKAYDWYFDGETGALIIEDKALLTISEDDFKSVVKSVVVSRLDALGKA